MKIIAPDYYTNFSCIAGKCKHNCCIGWEIDIDEDTYNYYKSCEEIYAHISADDTPHFVLTENERCPFLNKDNLCKIIINHGEKNLCQICTDHPRFRNFYDSRTEIGLGLCCEAAADLILSKKDKTIFAEIGEDDEPEYKNEDEEHFFNIRNDIFCIIRNRSLPLKERISKIIADYNIKMPQISIKEWAEFYNSLERLDEAWTSETELLKNAESLPKSRLSDIPFEQLLIYFIYRHLPESLYDFRFSERIAFSIISCTIIHALCCIHNADIKKAADIARMYSSEIEYSEDNIKKILDYIYSNR